MAQLALGVAGAAVGAAFGGPFGAQIGWLIGSAVGGALFPEKTEGPRLQDLHLQKSSYGGMVPIIMGRMRTPGNVIWQTDLTEHEHTESSGGKGGGPEQTNFTYSASFAIALCEGEIAEIPRVWANGRLVYDITQGSDFENGDFKFAVYLGTELQTPDPTMQAVLGAGNVPAYLGTAYVVFTDFNCSDYGNTIPNFEFEVVTKGLTGCGMRMVTQVTGQTPVWGSDEIFPGFTGYSDGKFRVTSIRSGGGSFGTGTASAQTDASGTFEYDIATLAALGPDVSNGTQENSADMYPRQLAIIAFDTGGGGYGDAVWNPLGVYYMADGTAIPLWIRSSELISGTTIKPCLCDARGMIGVDGDPPTVSNPNGDFAFNAGIPAGLVIYDVAFTANHRTLFVFTRDPAVGDPFALEVQHWWKIVNGLVVSDGPVDPVLGNSANSIVGNYGDSGFATNTSLSCEPDGRHFWQFSPVRGEIRMFTIQDDGKFVWDSACGLVNFHDDDFGNYGACLAWKTGFCVVVDGQKMAILTRFPEGQSLDLTLAEVIAALSVRAGLTEDDIDVTEGTDIVDGVIFAQQGPVRGMINSLQPAYFFDLAEIDDKIVLRKRGRASIATIPDDELAAHEKDTERPALLGIVRTQETDLPKLLHVDYMNLEADYQPGSQPANREVTRSEKVDTITLPIALTDNRAKAIAGANLFEQWLERDRGTSFVPLKWARLTPTDVVTVKGRDFRIKNTKWTPKGVFQLDVVPSLAAVYRQPQKSAPSTGIGGATLPTRVDTDLLLLDIPYITETEFPNGFYAAMAPHIAGGWPGASLQKSVDGGANYAQAASTSTRATFGATVDALGDFAGGDLLDEVNSVTVTVPAGATLSGTTLLGILNGERQYVIGEECLQSRDAELVDVDTWKLSGLRRGRHGTEFAMGSHEIGERFAVIPALDVDAPPAELGQARLYKPVTFGKTVAAAVAQSFTNRGARLRPLSPVHLAGGLDEDDGTILVWVPRTRVGGQWRDGTDANMSDPDNYVVEIWDSSYTFCARVIEVTGARTWTYSAADQASDFGAAQLHVYFTSAQKGPIGIGIRARGVAPGSGATDDTPLAPAAPWATGPLNPPPMVGGPFDQVLASGVRGYTAGFVVGGRYVWKFTTGASISTGSVSGAEYVDPRMRRQATLALNSDGTAPLVSLNASTFNFAFPFHYALAPLTSYYLIIEDKLPSGLPSGVLGDPSNMFADLVLNP